MIYNPMLFYFFVIDATDILALELVRAFAPEKLR